MRQMGSAFARGFVEAQQHTLTPPQKPAGRQWQVSLYFDRMPVENLVTGDYEAVIELVRRGMSEGCTIHVDVVITADSLNEVRGRLNVAEVIDAEIVD